MSRGLGQIQRAVLAIVADGSELTVISLAAAIFGVERPTLTSAQLVSVRRAVRQLHDAGMLGRTDWEHSTETFVGRPFGHPNPYRDPTRKRGAWRWANKARADELDNERRRGLAEWYAKQGMPSPV